MIDRDDPESLKLITHAKSKVVPFLDDAEAEEIEAAVVALENAGAPDVPAAREALAAAMRPYSYLF